MSIRGRLATLAATLLVVAVLVASPAASGDDGRLLVDVPGDGKGFVHDTDAPLLVFTRLAPGFSASGTLELRNTSGPAELSLRLLDVVESENGCVRPEQRDGDTTCTAGGGELADSLEVEVTRDGSPLWAGAFASLRDADVAITTVDDGEVVPLRVTVTMPREAGNDAMTDAVSFGLRWNAQGDTGTSTADVLGAEASTLPGSGADSNRGAGRGLPVVGTAIPAWLAFVDLAVLLAGVGLVTTAVRRNAVPAPTHRLRRVRR